MAYAHYLLDPQEMQDSLDHITRNHEEIINIFYLSDSAQICIVVKRDPGLDETMKELLRTKLIDDDDS